MRAVHDAIQGHRREQAATKLSTRSSHGSVSSRALASAPSCRSPHPASHSQIGAKRSRACWRSPRSTHRQARSPRAGSAPTVASWWRSSEGTSSGTDRCRAPNPGCIGAWHCGTWPEGCLSGGAGHRSSVREAADRRRGRGWARIGSRSYRPGTAHSHTGARP